MLPEKSNTVLVIFSESELTPLMTILPTQPTGPISTAVIPSPAEVTQVTASENYPATSEDLSTQSDTQSVPSDIFPSNSALLSIFVCHHHFPVPVGTYSN